MEIEEVAAKTPEKILTLTIDPATGVMPHHGRSVAKALKLEGDVQVVGNAVSMITKLYAAFVESVDMSMLEINPLVVTEDGNLLCLDRER